MQTNTCFYREQYSVIALSVSVEHIYYILMTRTISGLMVYKYSMKVANISSPLPLTITLLVGGKVEGKHLCSFQVN